jgi:hypothetical protein
MTSKVNSRLLTRWTVSERDVVICNVVEEVDFFFLQKQAGCDGVNWRISPPLIKETSILIERLEKVDIRLRP